ncbi:aldehyde dehydrogenase family protein [Paraburkholderia sp. BCC1886]|uniref:aldehyde dehydrogenase family protein n=1 Tax=Paraburkholderia sp. BCC1886 TaxID=2562670 RepID=UPI00118380F9|nr:aldehyde dehydrogenase family protein [Paraburkholderia sp. BCC1886]
MDLFDSFSMTIGGESVFAASTLPVMNPATEETVGLAPRADEANLDAAVAAARSAFASWRRTPLEQRQRLVRELAARVKAHEADFARLLTLEQGKPLHAARGSVYEVTSIQTWLEAISRKSPPHEVLLDTPERRVEVKREPLGVVGAIAPWNFPMTLAVWKIAPALVTGNTMVLKPSPFTPLTMLKFGELAKDVLPPGVLNVISGDDALGPWMTSHAGFDKIAFTGSTATGKAIMRSAADTMKRITLEMGGNDAAIVMDDVDLDKVVPRLFWGAFSNNAQFCLATKRLYVHDAIYERFAAALVAYAKSVKVGNGLEEGTQLGPVQNRRQYDFVRELIASSRAAGHEFLLGGEVPAGKGLFVPVTIVGNPPDDSRVVAEEAFGPVLPLLRFRTVDEVVRRANASDYGLGASVWSADVAQAQAIGARLEAGTVWINTIHILSPDYVFGGYKQSAFGTENGMDGFLEYTHTQTVVTDF